MVRVLLAPRSWPAHLLLLLAVAAAALLANWQFDVWSASRAAAAHNPAQAAVVPLDSLLAPAGDFSSRADGRPVSVSGTWVPAMTFFVSDHPNAAGKSGFWVVTLLDDGHGLVPVVRGWSTTPAAPAVSGSAALVGALSPSEDDGGAATGQTLGSVSVPRIAQFTTGRLYPGFVTAQTPTPGLAAAAQPAYQAVGWDTGLRNFLYGVQWWVFAGLAVWMWVRWCRDRVQEVRSGHVASAA